MPQLDIFGNAIAFPTEEKPPKNKPGKDTKKRKPGVPASVPAAVPKKQTDRQVVSTKAEKLGDRNARYVPGDSVEYRHPRGKTWLRGKLIGFYEPRQEDMEQKDVFSFIEVEVDGEVLKAFGLEQIRKCN